MSTRILLLSGYDALSHRHWRQRLAALLPEYQWQQHALPPRHFAWRLRSNSLNWGFSEDTKIPGKCDLLLATSMVDLASLRGFVPRLTAVPNIVYFHENQFSYPPGAQRHDNLEPLLVPLYSALCADKILFNSEYNRSSFLTGVKSLFNALPDKLPNRAYEHLEASEVIPVPLPDIGPIEATRSENSELLEIIWNHRWEYDKGIELLQEVVALLCQRELPAKLHLAGQQFRKSPKEFEKIQLVLERHYRNLNIAAGRIGFIQDQKEYEQLLHRCDVALSTALHDFQGLALQEACVAGCTPLAPKRLAYPEYLPDECLYPADQDILAQAEAIVEKLKAWLQIKQRGESLPKVELSAWQGEHIARRYRDCFEILLAENR